MHFDCDCIRLIPTVLNANVPVLILYCYVVFDAIRVIAFFLVWLCMRELRDCKVAATTKG